MFEYLVLELAEAVKKVGQFDQSQGEFTAKETKREVVRKFSHGYNFALEIEKHGTSGLFHFIG